MEFENCFTCGQGPYSINIPITPIRAPRHFGPKYCSKCGYQFWSECYSCGGKGYIDGGYCSSCGRKLPERKCYSCNGSGTIGSLATAHFCKNDIF